MPLDLVTRLVESLTGFVPVSFAARTSLLGVLLLTVAGGAHEYRNLVAQTTVTSSIQQVATQLQVVTEKLDDVKKVQDLTRIEANQRMDRLETKVDDLLRERRQRDRAAATRP